MIKLIDKQFKYSLNQDELVISLDLALHATGICLVYHHTLNLDVYQDKDNLITSDINNVNTRIKHFITYLKQLVRQTKTNLSTLIIEFTFISFKFTKINLQFYLYALITQLQLHFPATKFILVANNEWIKILRQKINYASYHKNIMNHKTYINLLIQQYYDWTKLKIKITQDEIDALGIYLSYYFAYFNYHNLTLAQHQNNLKQKHAQQTFLKSIKKYAIKHYLIIKFASQKQKQFYDSMIKYWTKHHL